MIAADHLRALGPELAAALARKGYDQLTAVQEAVLAPTLHGRDLRITSQTGSGKTLAIGFALREWIVPERGGAAVGPRALVVEPTRELARQTRDELQWLYAGSGARVVAITGGASYRDERRDLARDPAVIVGTPGRLLDHLNRGAIAAGALAAVVLDEADRLLDMGFREDLDAILAFTPAERRTHLVSATFPRGVRALADRVQRDPVHVEGTRLGAANVDIEHVIHVIDPRQKLDAIVNLLLADPEAQTLVFARTRADVGELAAELARAGFAATALSGELDQAARTRALSAFRGGRESVLVATDVAARGIDVQDVSRVIHAEPPTSADAYTHRAGRTGRAGRKGTSHVLVSLAQVVPVTRLLRAAGIAHRLAPIPSAESIRRAADARLFDELTAEIDAGAAPDERAHALARKLLAAADGETLLARLLMRLRASSGPEPREVRDVGYPERRPHGERRPRERRDGDRAVRGRERDVDRAGAYVPFRVSWGSRQGADARRLLAIACRRGGIRGSDVGAIRIEPDHAVLEVAAEVAQGFAKRAARPDRRDKQVRIAPLAPPRESGGHTPPKRRKR